MLLCEHGLDHYVESWLLETLQVCLASDVAPEFWAGLKQTEADSPESERARALLESFRKLLGRLTPFLCKLLSFPGLSLISCSSAVMML